MASEIRVDKINSLSGVGTVTLSPTGVDIAGITTVATLKATTGIVTTLTATTGIVTTLTANTVTANTTAKVGTGITLSPDGDVFATGVTTCLGTAVLGNAIIGSGTTITADGVNAGIITANELISSAPLPSLKLLDSANNYYAYLDGNSGNLILHSDKGASNSDSNMKFAIDNATKMTLNADGELGVGGSFDPNQMIDVRKSDSSTFNAASNLPTMIRVYNTSPTNGNCAGIQIRADNSAGAAGIQYIHTVTSSTAYDSDLVFSRRLATSGAYAETARFTNAGNLAFPNGGGIDFYNYGSGSNITSNALDDYEEGTWTPGASGFTISSTISARYTKIGRMVTVNAYVNAATGSGTSAVVITNLPYSQYGNSNYHYGSGRIGSAGANTNSQNNIVFQVQQNAAEVKIYVNDGGINEQMISGQHIIFSATYEAA